MKELFRHLDTRAKNYLKVVYWPRARLKLLVEKDRVSYYIQTLLKRESGQLQTLQGAAQNPYFMIQIQKSKLTLKFCDPIWLYDPMVKELDFFISVLPEQK